MFVGCVDDGNDKNWKDVKKTKIMQFLYDNIVLISSTVKISRL